MEKAHFEQAKFWLEGAKYISNFGEDREKYAVAMSMCIHSMSKTTIYSIYKWFLSMLENIL